MDDQEQIVRGRHTKLWQVVGPDREADLAVRRLELSRSEPSVHLRRDDPLDAANAPGENG